MKVLVVHNFYRRPGGEDEVFRRESELLQTAGHEVVRYVRHNHEISDDGILSRVKIGAGTFWNGKSAREMRSVLRKEKPEIVHFHNTFPLISPAAYYACKEEGVPVVQSLHNPRLLCPAATLYRSGQECEACIGRRVMWPAIVHACYHNSRSQTAAVTGMLALHQLLGTWHEQVDAYIVFTDFFRRKFIAAGVPAEKVYVKPHFLDVDPGVKNDPGTYALFVGRLVPEKGVLTMLKAWRSLKHVPLRIAGDGDLAKEVLVFQQAHPWVCTLPHVPHRECLSLIKGARFLVWPSEGYNETFGLVALEAFACGTPLIASRAGAMEEMVKEGRTGLHFEPGNAEELADQAEWAWSHMREMENMGRTARAEYEAEYTAERNYRLLMEIYNRAQNKCERKAA